MNSWKKQIIKTFEFILPPFLTCILKSLYLLVRKPETWQVSVKQFNKNYEKMIVFGNGPSLNDSIRRYRNCFDRAERVAVNSFANTQYYEDIKPSMYVLADPVFFLDKTEIAERTRIIVEQLEKNLIEKTKWNLGLFVPNFGKESAFVNTIKNNPNITVYYFNMHDHLVPFGKKMKYWFWDHNWIALAGNTVLNTCVNLGIILRYKEIYLLGADSNWHEQLKVDQKDNRLYSLDKHFYGERKTYVYADSYSKTPERLDRELVTISKAFRSYWELKEYAKSRNVGVFNSSEYSVIDAFPRKKIQIER